MNPLRPMRCTSIAINLKGNHEIARPSGRRNLFLDATGANSLHGAVAQLFMTSNTFIASMSSSLSSKPNKSALLAMRFAEVDLGMTTTSRCTFHLSTTCAGVTPYFFANPTRISFSNNSPPCAKGEYAVTVNPFDCEYLTNESLLHSGCDSIWLHAGWIFVLGSSHNAASCASLKLLTPMCRTNPSATHRSSSLQHSAMDASASGCSTVPRFHATGQ